MRSQVFIGAEAKKAWPKILGGLLVVKIETY
jgi:hypothetical protein